MTWLFPDEPPLAVDEIQGHVLVGFGGTAQALGAFTARDLPGAARAVGAWAKAGYVTSARTLLPRKGRRAKEFMVTSGPWTTISVSPRLLASVGAPAGFADVWLTSTAGMRGITQLGDPEGQWVVGGADAPVDVLLVAAAGSTSAAEELLQWFAEKAGDAVEMSWSEPLTPLSGGIEHFGFRDGISQPAVIGLVDGQAFEDTRGPEDRAARPYAAAGQELVWPGEFLFGYPRRHRNDPWRPGPTANAGDPATSAFARNGTLLVYRRLEQDVSSFRAFCAEAARACDGLDAESLQARIVGRWPSGLPISEAPADPPPGREDPAYNDFTFDDDAMAAACPRAAHIRKVNPRRGGTDQDNAVPRLLRRGAPFGPPYVEGEVAPPPHGRGLAFLAYQSSIVNQFGKITADWMNDSSAPSNGGGYDLLVGQLTAGDQRFFDVPPRIYDDHRSWVEPTGGAFLFTPSITALLSLGDLATRRGATHGA